jgi:nitroreductase
MDTFEAIRRRRSVKQYDPSFVMPPEHERQLLEAALLSPTSFNIQHWRFIIAKDPAVKKQLRAAAFNQAQVEEAQLTIVLCADLHAWNREPERYYREAPEKTRNYLVPMLQNIYRDKPEMMRDEAMRSVGIAAQTLMLGAKALGYDSGALVGFDPAKVAEIIRLPDDHVIGMILVIGKRARDAHPRSGQLPHDEVVFIDGFPDPMPPPAA